MKRRYDSRLGKLLFVLPALVIVIVVVYAFITLSSPGTLIVSAENSNQVQLNVKANVNGQTVTTPSTIKIARGEYEVNFSSIEWYYPPPARDVSVQPGQTVYAVGAYIPQTRFVQVTSGGFNETAITALHALTPVTWTNPTDTLQTFSGGPFSTVRLNPGQSYTYVFPSPGQYVLYFGNTNDTLTVDIE
jgi:hypothetical protein